MSNYHGSHKKRQYFEGWYCKQQNDQQTIAFIPAYHIDQAGNKTASIQVVTDHGSYVTEPFPENAFHADKSKFNVQIGDNRFSQEGLNVNIHTNGLTVKGRLEFGLFTPLTSDIMGPFCLVPGMQCRHGVYSMTHTVDGELRVNGESMSFKRHTGYIETDRGRSFPKTYLWTQCNWQDKKPCSLMLSIADIPVGKTSFTGCICSILYGGQQYRLATYQGGRPLLWDKNIAVIRQGKYRLEVELLEQETTGHALQAPVKGGMSRVIHERPACRVHYRFYKHAQPVFDLVSSKASFEYAKA